MFSSRLLKNINLNFIADIIQFLFFIFVVSSLFFDVICIYSKDILFDCLLPVFFIALIIIIFFHIFTGFPFWLCLYERSILDYLNKLDQKGNNDKIYLIYKNNERSFLIKLKTYFLTYLTIVCLLLTFTDKLGFSIQKFSNHNINDILNYKFEFIADLHFWLFLTVFSFYYLVFVYIRRKNISKVLFKYFNLKTFKRNDLMESRTIKRNFKRKKIRIKDFFYKKNRYNPKHISSTKNNITQP